MVGAHAAPLKPSPLALAQRVQRTNGLGSTIRASAGSGRVEHAQKCELASVKILAISASTKHSRSVVHAAPIQRPSVQFALARAAEATARATGRVLQSFEQTPQRASLSQPAIIRGKSASRRGDGLSFGLRVVCMSTCSLALARSSSVKRSSRGRASGSQPPRSCGCTVKRPRGVEVEIDATGTPSPRASHI